MSNTRSLPRAEVYGQPLSDLLSILVSGQEPKNPIYLYTNAFVDELKKGRLPEYRGWSDAEEIAWKERDAYEKFRTEALRTIPGLTKEELPPARDYFYVLRSALRRHLSKQAHTTLEDELVRLGSSKPSLQKHLRPVLDHLKTSSAKLDSNLRRQANDALRKAGFDGNGRFRSVGSSITTAFRVLEKYGIEPDEVFSAFTYQKPEGVVPMRIAFSNPDDPFSPDAITNSVLHFSWTELRPDQFEIVAYLS